MDRDSAIVKYIRAYLLENIIDHESITNSMSQADDNVLHNTPKEIIENIKQRFKLELMKLSKKFDESILLALQSAFDTNIMIFVPLLQKGVDPNTKYHDTTIDMLLKTIKSINPDYNTETVKSILSDIITKIREEYEPILQQASGNNNDPNNRNDKIGYYNEFSPKEHYRKI